MLFRSAVGTAASAEPDGAGAGALGLHATGAGGAGATGGGRYGVTVGTGSPMTTASALVARASSSRLPATRVRSAPVETTPIVVDPLAVATKRIVPRTVVPVGHGETARATSSRYRPGSPAPDTPGSIGNIGTLDPPSKRQYVGSALTVTRAPSISAAVVARISTASVSPTATRADATPPTRSATVTRGAAASASRPLHTRLPNSTAPAQHNDHTVSRADARTIALSAVRCTGAIVARTAFSRRYGVGEGVVSARASRLGRKTTLS